MQYRFARVATDYSDFASGAVLHSAPGRPAFPVRLASELFQRAHHLWRNGATPRRCVLYDPCCGTGYLLAVVALLHGNAIRSVLASDVDRDVLEIAARNLDLLHPGGMRRRIEALTEKVRRFGKDSHRLAVRSAERLLEEVEARAEGGEPMEVRLFQADVMDTREIGAGMDGTLADIVFTDPPYGVTTGWASGSEQAGSVMSRMLASLRPAVADDAVVVTVQPSGTRFEADDYSRVQRFRSGHREALFWRAR